MLLIAGNGPDNRVRHAFYVDPTDDFRLSMGESDGGEIRGYHSISILLPDGRVLVGGGRDETTATSLEKPSFRFYYPQYMFASRPTIVSAPTMISYGERFTVESDTSTPTEAVLISLGSMTHSFDMNQRSIQLDVAEVVASGSGRDRSVVIAPTDASAAPPGPYMLFLLDADRIPSMARMLTLR